MFSLRHMRVRLNMLELDTSDVRWEWKWHSFFFWYVLVVGSVIVLTLKSFTIYLPANVFTRCGTSWFPWENDRQIRMKMVDFHGCHSCPFQSSKKTLDSWPLSNIRTVTSTKCVASTQQFPAFIYIYIYIRLYTYSYIYIYICICIYAPCMVFLNIDPNKNPFMHLCIQIDVSYRECVEYVWLFLFEIGDVRCVFLLVVRTPMIVLVI